MAEVPSPDEASLNVSFFQKPSFAGDDCSGRDLPLLAGCRQPERH